jgi:hypothetical protein
MLHFAQYNFVRIHPSLRVTPAIAAGVSDRLWFIEELIDIAIDGEDAAWKKLESSIVKAIWPLVTWRIVSVALSGLVSPRIPARNKPGYDTFMVDEDPDKDRALWILRAQGFEVVDVQDTARAAR